MFGDRYGKTCRDRGNGPTSGGRTGEARVALGSKERFSFQAPEFTEELKQLDRDVDAVCFAEFTDEEIRQYRDMEERIGNCILHHLQAETAKES